MLLATDAEVLAFEPSPENLFALTSTLANAQFVPRTATSKICGNKWPVRNLLKDLSRSHLCFENSFDLSYKICHL